MFHIAIVIVISHIIDLQALNNIKLNRGEMSGGNYPRELSWEEGDDRVGTIRGENGLLPLFPFYKKISAALCVQ